MKKQLIYLSLIILLFVGQKLLGQGPALQLSEQAKISILTGSPGNELYNGFGHSAVWIQDPVRRIDLLYNYGTFNFDTPNFYQKFVQRKLLYQLSKGNIHQLARVYQLEKRAIYVHELQLPLEQKQVIFELLEKNYLPENREYLYDFFYDNCATRIRDILQEALGDELKFEQKEEARGFRTFLDEYLGEKYWLNFGIYLILGMEADKKADYAAQMFLPDYLASNFLKATYQGKPLLSGQKIILPYPEKENSKASFWTPTPVMWLLFLILSGITYLLNGRKLILNILDAALFSIMGLAGAFLLFMWLGTDHIATQSNLNTLWANPLYLIWVFIGLRAKKANWVKYVEYLLIFLLGFSLLLFILPLQSLHPATLPLILLLIWRLIHRTLITAKDN